jgi:hypothetical protein
MRALLPLGAGLLALIVGTAFGWDAGLVDALVAPPALVRAVLVAASVLIGIGLLRRAVAMMAVTSGSVEPEAAGARDLAGMVRAVRLVFLAVAAFAAAAGWVLGSALPLVAALIIAGIDVVETSFLLLVVSLRREA